MIRFAVPAILLLAGLTAADAGQKKPDPELAKIEKRLEGLTPGKPMSCISRFPSTQTMSADGVILYIAGKNRVYRNDIVGGCAGLSQGDIIVTKSFSSDLCSGDMVETRSPPSMMFTGACALGKFTPYTKAK